MDTPAARGTFAAVMTPPAPPPPVRPGLRHLWPFDPGLTFLNHGSFGGVPRPVAEAQAEWRRRVEADPVELLGRRCEGLIEAAKRPVGDRFGMRPADFGFVTNASEGVNAVLRSVALAPGDELLTTDHVYGAVRQTMRLAARRAGAVCREVAVPLPVASAGEVLAAVVAGLTDRTRLVVVDHVTSPTGLVFPVAAVAAECRRRGVDVLVDGAHVPGMLPLDVAAVGATYYAANLHKWVCAPKGTAFLWVDPARQAEVHPTVVSHNLDEGFAREFAWQGTRDVSAWLAAPAALAFLADLGWDRVLDHNHRLAAWAHGRLTAAWGVEPISPPDGSLLGSTAAVRLPGRLAMLDGAGLAAMQQRLHDEFRVEVPLVGWPGGNLLRVSCQVYNEPADYDRLADVITAVAAEA